MGADKRRMLYSPDHNFIFVHVWKTAGESVVSSLKPYCPWYFSDRLLNGLIRYTEPVSSKLDWRYKLVCRQHAWARAIRAIMPEQEYNKAFKFAFVRNPFDILVSSYNYSVQSWRHPEHKIVKKLGSFSEYAKWRQDVHPIQQKWFVTGASGELIVDKVGKFETLSDDFNEITRTIGIDASLPHVNASDRKKDWRAYYDDQTYELVGQIYKEDIDFFGY